MKIEVLYFDGCPNHEPAVERIHELLREEGISAEVVEVNVSDASIAQKVGFLGSPKCPREWCRCRARGTGGPRVRDDVPHLLGGRPERRVAIARSVAPGDPGSEFRHQQFGFG
jgi:hypothetical protein